MELEHLKIKHSVRTGSDGNRLKARLTRSLPLPVLTAFQTLKKRKIYSFEKVFCVAVIFLLLSACQKNQETIENKVAVFETPKTIEDNQPKPTKSLINSLQKTPIDVSKLANKTVAEIDKIFGQSVEIKEISQPNKGEYRVYKIADEPKGLAIRFYDGRAKNFNLILSAPVSTAKDALKKTFAIDVGNQPPTKDKIEPLTEMWQGSFSGMKFSKVSAKRESGNKGFVFVLAEVE